MRLWLWHQVSMWFSVEVDGWGNGRNVWCIWWFRHLLRWWMSGVVEKDRVKCGKYVGVNGAVERGRGRVAMQA